MTGDEARRALERHPAVHAARLVPGAGDLIEVEPTPAGYDGVAGWQYMFEDLYDEAADRGRAGAVGADADAAGDPRHAGWIDGLTREPVPADQMDAWVDGTVGRILALRPHRVLEIGAGTGLVLGRLLAHVRGAPGGGAAADRGTEDRGTEDHGLDEYVATDFAAASVEILRELAERAGAADRVRVHQGAAHEPLPRSAAGGYDLVVLNSVVQYFPSTDYLEQVLAAAAALCAPGGHVLLGDLKDATLLERYYRRLPGRAGADADGARRRDHELSLTPDYARSLIQVLDAVTAVETAPRRGRHRNEMALFRFDALLHLGCPVPQAADRPALAPADPARSLDPVEQVARHLAAPGAGPALWSALPNARLDPGPGAADPERLWALDGRDGWRVRVGCAPGSGLDRLTVWAAPPGADAAAGAHFTLAWPGPGAAGGPAAAAGSAVVQSPLPPGPTRALLDALQEHLRGAAGLGAGPPPALRLVPARPQPIAQEDTPG
jgi:SAM-dependent methyltransferase